MSCLRLHLILLTLVIVFGLGLDSSQPVLLGKETPNEKQSEPFALLIGTCFNESGFSLPGAKVVVELTSESAVKLKRKKWEMVSSPRGEFAIRLPAGQLTFKVKVSKDGFKPAEKTVYFEGDERQDIVLRLEAEPGKK